MFYPNQKVVCVDDSNPGDRAPWVVKGKIYTVRMVDAAADGCRGLNFYELPYEDDNSTWYFRASRFRPLTDTSISDVLAKAAPKDSHEWDNRRRIKEKVS